MVRRTEPDRGIWDFVDPAKLVMPADTHVHRIATLLGLDGRKTPNCDVCLVRDACGLPVV